MTALPAVGRWRPASGLEWTRFDDSNEWVVYHPGSCDAHLVTESAYRLWTLLSDEQPHTLSDIVVVLGAEFDRPPDAEMTDAVRETLDFMDRAGLLRPLPA